MALDKNEIRTVVRQYLDTTDLKDEIKSLLAESLNDIGSTVAGKESKARPHKQILELGYWLARGALTPSEFDILVRKISEDIPTESNDLETEDSPKKNMTWYVLAPGHFQESVFSGGVSSPCVLDKDRPIIMLSSKKYVHFTVSNGMACKNFITESYYCVEDLINDRGPHTANKSLVMSPVNVESYSMLPLNSGQPQRGRQGCASIIMHVLFIIASGILLLSWLS